jgi:hypothetical protein
MYLIFHGTVCFSLWDLMLRHALYQEPIPQRIIFNSPSDDVFINKTQDLETVHSITVSELPLLLGKPHQKGCTDLRLTLIAYYKMAMQNVGYMTT